jgi:SAM-dependent methyltransferase
MNSKEKILDSFTPQWYLAHNAMRQYHLASLNLPLEGKSVLELGAGIGLHTKFFLDRHCKVMITDGRSDNVALAKERHPNEDVCLLDIENPGEFSWVFDIVYCYGVLYHLADPLKSLNVIARWCGGMLLLETCVSTESQPQVKVEDVNHAGAALRGQGNYPDRRAVLLELKRLFPHVYVPVTHPMGMAFDMPLDWIDPRGECRAVFIASHSQIKGYNLKKIE